MANSRRGAPVLLAILLGVPATAIAATSAAQPSHEAVEATRWGMAIGLVALLVPLFIWRGVVKRHAETKALSTSKTIAAFWTYLVASILLGFVIAQFMDHPQALNAIQSGLAGDYAVLFGGPLGAAIISKRIWASGIQAAAAAAGTSTAAAAKADANASLEPSTVGSTVKSLVTNSAGDDDLGNLQYVLFNLVAMVFVIGTVFQKPTAGLPNIPDVLLALTSVSAVGYVAKKAVPALKSSPAPVQQSVGGASTSVAQGSQPAAPVVAPPPPAPPSNT
jgi:hypothetical protein